METVQEGKKRQVEEDGKQESSQPNKKAKTEGPEGYKKYFLKGLEGVKQEALAGVLDRSAVPYAMLWKQRAKDSAVVWLPEEPIIAKVR